jgi:ADP-heptose:LPS heptosyltransferase
MRKLDALLGNIACNVLATAKQVAAPFSAPPKSLRKIAVMKFFGLGSIAVATPALQAIRAHYPNAEICFITFKGNRDLLEMLKLTDRNYYVDPTSARSFTQSTLQVIRELRKAQIDLAIDLEFFAKFPLVLASLAGIPRKAGFYLTAESWRRTMLDIPGSYNHYYHTKDIFLSLVYRLVEEDPYYLGFNAFSRRFSYPRLRPEAADVDSVNALLEAKGVRQNTPLIVINPNTSPELAPEARKWPEDRYTELALELCKLVPGAKVVLTGAKGEAEYVNRIVLRAADARVFSLAGQMNLRQLMALFDRAALFVSNDSGPMHLACLVDAPTIGLFFADTPTLFAPIGSQVASIAPDTYGLPLFTVYNGKDVLHGRPAGGVKNVLAQTVTVEEVLRIAGPMLTKNASRATSNQNEQRN